MKERTMDSGLTGLLKAERTKLMQQVAQIDALLGQSTVGTTSNGNGHTNGVEKVRGKAGRGVSDAIRAVLGESPYPVETDAVAKQVHLKGLYTSRRRAFRSVEAILYQMRKRGEAKRTASGAWTAKA
jgi:hypothetical protein